MRQQSLETEDSGHLVVGYEDSRIIRRLSCKNGIIRFGMCLMKLFSIIPPLQPYKQEWIRRLGFTTNHQYNSTSEGKF